MPTRLMQVSILTMYRRLLRGIAYGRFGPFVAAQPPTKAHSHEARRWAVGGRRSARIGCLGREVLAIQHHQPLGAFEPVETVGYVTYNLALPKRFKRVQPFAQRGHAFPF